MQQNVAEPVHQMHAQQRPNNNDSDSIYMEQTINTAQFVQVQQSVT